MTKAQLISKLLKHYGKTRRTVSGKSYAKKFAAYTVAELKEVLAGLTSAPRKSKKGSKKKIVASAPRKTGRKTARKTGRKSGSRKSGRKSGSSKSRANKSKRRSAAAWAKHIKTNYRKARKSTRSHAAAMTELGRSFRRKSSSRRRLVRKSSSMPALRRQDKSRAAKLVHAIKKGLVPVRQGLRSPADVAGGGASPTYRYGKFTDVYRDVNLGHLPVAAVQQKKIVVQQPKSYTQNLFGGFVRPQNYRPKSPFARAMSGATNRRRRRSASRR